MTLVTCPRCNRQVAGGRFCPGCGSRLDDPLTGKVLAGRVKLVAQTARGPYYATYRAEHKSGGASWSVKVLEPAVAGDDGRKRRFLENAGAMLALGDPRLLAVREMAEEEIADGGGRSRRLVFAVSDAPSGPSLAELVRRQGPMDTARTAAFGRGLLGALGAIHAARIVHGDLHPGCLYLEPEAGGGERVRVADAGLSPGLASATGDGPDPASLGSDGGRWVSPEQAAGQPAGTASDLHAAGAVLYFALTGTPPWQAEKGAPLLYEIQKSVPRAASELQARVPPALDQVLDRALAKSPGERFRTAAEFAQALAEAAAGVAAVPRQALPQDVTPGALTLAGIQADGPDVTMTAPPARRAPPLADATVARAAPASGDETIIGSASAVPPPTVHRAAAPPAPAPAKPAAPPPPAKPAPRAAPKPAEPRPAPAPAAAPAAAEERTVRSPPREPPATRQAPATKPAPAAAPATPAKAPKPVGRWSVGTPVGVFASVLFLGVAALYGFVWAGRLDWDLPPWARTLTGRDAIPHIGDGVSIPPQKVVAVKFNVEVPSEIALPMEGEGAQAHWGSWRIDRILAPPAEGAVGAAGGAAPAEAVFARGALAGPPDPSTGVIPIPLTLPPGRYRLHAQLRYGTVATDEVAVADKGGMQIESFPVQRGTTLLVVRVQQEVGEVVVKRLPEGTEHAKTVTPQMKAVAFGLPEDGRERALRFGDRVRVRISAPGYDTRVEENVILRDNPHELKVDLKENAEGKVKLALIEIEARGNPGQYAADALVMADARVKVAMAKVFASRSAYADFDRTVEDLMTTPREKPLPPEAGAVLGIYAEWRRGMAASSAERGDLEDVRLQRLKCARALEFLPAPEAAAERAKWARLEIDAWMKYPMPPAEDGGTPDPDRAPVERMVLEDLKILAPDDPGAEIRRRVAERILEHRAWPAWNAGNDLRPAGEKEPRAIPGPAVRPWLELCVKAWPGVEDTLSYQRLAARLEEIGRSARAVVCLLLGDREWTPARVLPIQRIDLLTRKDRLLLARALRQLGNERQEAAAAPEAQALWGQAWESYQRCFPRAGEGATDEFPDALLRAARFEAALVAELVKDKDTALRAWDEYLGLQPEDPDARRRREALARKDELRPSEQMRMLGHQVVSIPPGRFRVGLDPTPPGAEEQPFRDNTVVPVNSLPARDFLFDEYLISVVEVTVGQYRAYLEAMADPERAKLYRHRDEPADWGKQPGRRPQNLDSWGPDEPVRGVAWWDAWACANFLGGRLPTEAEWEKAAFWSGRETPGPVVQELEDLRAGFRDWPAHWPTIAVGLSPFDRAPSGARGFVAGVSEWTMDPFVPRTPGAREGLAENLPQVPPELKAGSAEVMCVRGGSYFHRAPGEPPGDSPAELREEAPAPGAGGKQPAGPAAPKPQWRGASLTERRGIPAGRAPKFVGFRVVISSRATERPR